MELGRASDVLERGRDKGSDQVRRITCELLTFSSDISSSNGRPELREGTSNNEPS
jgi:hypothetical protein